MEPSGKTLTVWTEGLGEFWGIAPELIERRQREPMTPETLANVIDNILLENGHTASGLFILEAANKRLNLALTHGVIEISDPKNVNYQNVAMALDDLVKYLEAFFFTEVAANVEQTKASPVRMVEYIVASAAVVFLIFTVSFVSKFLENNSGFMPVPEITEIGNQDEIHDAQNRYAGVYTTGMDDGETILELKKDGSWGFYDIQRSTAGSYFLDLVQMGNYRPVYKSGRLAILTDSLYLLYPEDQENLLFLQRSFSRVAKTREDLTNVAFPDDAMERPLARL